MLLQEQQVRIGKRGTPLIDGHTSLYGFIADPAKHSLSPLIHNTSFQALSLNSVYLAFEVDQAHLADAVNAIRTLPILGANVSMPHKQAIIPLLDSVTETSQQLEAVNTVINRDGRLIGDSTDGEGFLGALADADVAVKNQSIVVLGAGGAGRAIIAACARNGGHVTVFKRRNATYESVSNRLASWSGDITVRPYDDVGQMQAAVAAADIVVNTTNVGMAGEGDLPVPPEVLGQLHPGQVVADAIYFPLETALLRQARRQGCQVLNGLGMLVHQAADSFQQWTGATMPIETVKKAVQQQLLNSTK